MSTGWSDALQTSLVAISYTSICTKLQFMQQQQECLLLCGHSAGITWEDGAGDANGSAVLHKLQEALHPVEQLGDDELGTGVNLNRQGKQTEASSCCCKYSFKICY